MLTFYVFAHSSLAVLAARAVAVVGRRTTRDERGQASAEYALVLLGAAAVALTVTAWAAKTGRISRLLDAVLDRLLDQVR